MYVQSHARLWIINDYDDIFHAFFPPLLFFLQKERRRRKKFPNSSPREEIIEKFDVAPRRCFFIHVSYPRLIIPHVTRAT